MTAAVGDVEVSPDDVAVGSADGIVIFPQDIFVDVFDGFGRHGAFNAIKCLK